MFQKKVMFLHMTEMPEWRQIQFCTITVMIRIHQDDEHLDRVTGRNYTLLLNWTNENVEPQTWRVSNLEY